MELLYERSVFICCYNQYTILGALSGPHSLTSCSGNKHFLYDDQDWLGRFFWSYAFFEECWKVLGPFWKEKKRKEASMKIITIHRHRWYCHQYVKADAFFSLHRHFEFRDKTFSLLNYFFKYLYTHCLFPTLSAGTFSGFISFLVSNSVVIPWLL